MKKTFKTFKTSAEEEIINNNKLIDYLEMLERKEIPYIFDESDYEWEDMETKVYIVEHPTFLMKVEKYQYKVTFEDIACEQYPPEYQDCTINTFLKYWSDDYITVHNMVINHDEIVDKYSLEDDSTIEFFIRNMKIDGYEFIREYKNVFPTLK